MSGRSARRRRERRPSKEGLSAAELESTIVEVEEEMLAAAEDLRFEYAARLRDELRDLRRQMSDAEGAGIPAAD